MKKLFLATIVALSCMTISASAQLCSNCPTGKTEARSSGFSPAIFTPVPIGGHGYGTAYLKMVPIGHYKFLTAYIYMRDANGKIIEVPISMDMDPYRPSHWPTRFEHNYVQDKESPNTYWYRDPEPVSFLIQIMPVDSNMGGQPLTNPDGSVYAVQKITFVG